MPPSQQSSHRGCFFKPLTFKPRLTLELGKPGARFLSPPPLPIPTMQDTDFTIALFLVVFSVACCLTTSAAPTDAAPDQRSAPTSKGQQTATQPEIQAPQAVESPQPGVNRTVAENPHPTPAPIPQHSRGDHHVTDVCQPSVSQWTPDLRKYTHGKPLLKLLQQTPLSTKPSRWLSLEDRRRLALQGITWRCSRSIRPVEASPYRLQTRK